MHDDARGIGYTLSHTRTLSLQEREMVSGVGEEERRKQKRRCERTSEILEGKRKNEKFGRAGRALGAGAGGIVFLFLLRWHL